MKSLKDIQRAVKAFTIQPTPGMRDRVLDAALALQQQRNRPQTRGATIRRMIMRSTQFSATAAVLILAVVGLTHLFGPGTGSAFANAMEQFAAAETARFDLTIEFGEQAPQTSSFFYDAKGYIRQNMADGTVNFVDYNTGKVLSMVPDANTVFIRNTGNQDFHAALYDVFTHLQDLIGRAIETGYGDVESLENKTINGRTAYGWRLETTAELSDLFWQGKGTLTIWADTETDIPLTLTWRNTMTDIVVTISNIQLDVIFAPHELAITIPEGYMIQDETLSSVKPDNAPRSEVQIQPRGASAAMKIADLVEGLGKTDETLLRFFHSWTVLTKGRFPSSLTTDAIKDIDPDATLSFAQEQWSYSLSANFDLSGILGDDWKAGIDPNDYTAEEKELLKEKRGRYHDALQAALNQALEGIKPCFEDVFKGFELINELPARSDWHYTGADVEPGDADAAIFRYRPEGSEIYRVIYGDLTIGDIEPEDLDLLQTPSPEEADRQANDALEAAIQLGADIPEDKRPIVLRMLSLNEKDLINGLAVWLEMLDGTYPDSLETEAAIRQSNSLLAEKYYDGDNVITGKEKELERKTYNIFFASAFYDKLVLDKKDVVYYGGGLTDTDGGSVLIRWKTSKGRYRVVFGDLTRETVTAEELAALERPD